MCRLAKERLRNSFVVYIGTAGVVLPLLATTFVFGQNPTLPALIGGLLGGVLGWFVGKHSAPQWLGGALLDVSFCDSDSGQLAYIPVEMVAPFDKLESFGASPLRRTPLLHLAHCLYQNNSQYFAKLMVACGRLAAHKNSQVDFVSIDAMAADAVRLFERIAACKEKRRDSRDSLSNLEETIFESEALEEERVRAMEDLLDTHRTLGEQIRVDEERFRLNIEALGMAGKTARSIQALCDAGSEAGAVRVAAGFILQDLEGKVGM